LWLLVAAWVCASTPPATRVAFAGWMAEARTFAHQGRLTLDVARLLTGEHETPVVDRAPNRVAPPAPPPLPIDFLGKKLDLKYDEAAAMMPPEWRANPHFSRLIAAPESWRAAPPHEPPRAAARQV
jgi:hypothetical protein